MLPKENFVLILGAGITGLSAINYLKGKKNFKVFDTRNIHELPLDFVNDESIKTNLISLKDIKFELIEYVICSPGFDYDHEIIQLLKKNNISIKSDIEIFVEENNSKKILVSGTNGKTTVSLLLERIISLSGLDSFAIGNLGKPVLDYISLEKDYFIIEVSSFHLQISNNLDADIGILLNISHDHLDRHKSFENYVNIKNSLFGKCKVSIGNKNDKNIKRGLTSYFEGSEKIDEANLNAVSKVLEKIDLNCSQEELKKFSFKPNHRMELFHEDKLGRKFINDSKATNCGATISAIKSLKNEKIVIICGGQGKGADFSELTSEIDKKCEAVIIYGEDKKQIGSKVKTCNKYYVNNLKEAILKALNLSKPKFTILFSPACASFDMFNNFEERGEEFKRLILNEGNT